MDLNIKKGRNIEEIALFIASSINRELHLGKKVLWFVSGGSAIIAEAKASQQIKNVREGSLVVTLADERYGEVGHLESNWTSLKNMGFNVEGAKLIPVLNSGSMREATLEFQKILENELEIANYKIGVFGVGLDGHTAGILPHSDALNDTQLAVSYITPFHNRITITPKTISMLDEAILYAMGESKLSVIEEMKNNLPVENQPVQALKKVPLLTIFTN